AAWRVEEFEAARTLEDELQRDVNGVFQIYDPTRDTSDNKKKAVKAMLFQGLGDQPSAHAIWSGYNSSAGERSGEKWFLLARKRMHAIKLPDTDDETLKLKINVVKKSLATAEKEKAQDPDRSARTLQVINYLYGDDTNPEVMKVIESARELHKDAANR